ncbi:MAG: hypothetical protein ACM3ZU_01415 [Bacteroidota bacterium]
MGNASDIQSILSHCIFFVDRRSRLSRGELHPWLVELALFQAGRALTVNEIARCVFSKVIPLGATSFEPSWVEGVVRKLTKKGRIEERKQRGSDVYQLSQRRRSQIVAAKQRFDMSKQEFERVVLAACTASPIVPADFSEKQQQAILKAVHATVQQIFLRNAIKFGLLAETLSGKPEVSLNIEECEGAESVLSKGLDEALGPLDLRVPVIKHTIIKALTSSDPLVRQYLTLCHHQVLYMHLLGIDPSLQKYQRTLLEHRTIVLDTNMVLPLMFTHHDLHVVVRDLLRDAQRLGMTLAVFPWTVDEIGRCVNGAKTSFVDYNSKTLEDRREIERMADIVAQMVSAGRDLSGLDIETFFAGLEPRLWLKENNIRVLDLEPSTDEVKANELRSIAYEAKDKRAILLGKAGARTDIVEHDVQCLLGVDTLRGSASADPMGPRVWFLTRDTTLQSIEKEAIRHHKLYDLPCSLRMDDFVQELVAYQYPRISSDGCSDYVALLVELELGTIDFDEETETEKLLITMEAPAVQADSALEASEEMLEHQTATFAKAQLAKSLLSEQERERAEQLGVLLGAVSKTLAQRKEEEQRRRFEEEVQERMDDLEARLSQRELEAVQQHEKDLKRIGELEGHLSDAQAQLSQRKARERRLIGYLVTIGVVCSIGLASLLVYLIVTR